MNKSQSNLVKQAEKIVINYSKKKGAPNTKKTFCFLASGIIILTTATVILLRMYL